jgi:enoyl-CoA hydratase/carnithine racemase
METVQTALSDGVGTLTLNRPDAYNAITIELSRALEAGVRELASEARTIVIRGAGKNFCVGGDFKQMDALRAEGTEAVRELFVSFHRAAQAIAEVPVPVIAAVHGIACAGGFELALASDIVLLADSAKLADIHLQHAMVPGGGSTQRLPRMVGAQRALALILTGDRLSAAEAVNWGIAYRSFPDAEFTAAVDQFAATMAAKDPAALRRAKYLIREGLTHPLEQGIELELETVLEHLSVAAEFVKGAA